MSAYTVTATRWEGGWELNIEGVGVTQAVTLAAAERTVRSYLALDGHDDANTAKLELHYKLEDEIDSAIEHARVKIAEAERLRDESALEYRKVAQLLVERAHLSGADAARVLRVSPQRFSQLINS